MATVLRPYQQDAVNQIRAHAARGPKKGEAYGCILQLATGAGKTAIFCDVLKGAYNKGRRGIMVVRGKALVHQASERLTREGVEHGIFQGDRTRDTGKSVLVCSVDTLFARKEIPPADIVVIDECHLSQSPGYQWLLSNYSCFKLGVSATPHHRQGMGHIGNHLIRPESFVGLVRGGFLCSGRYFVPYTPNLKGVSKSGGDFNTKELGARARDDEELTASAKGVWSKYLRGKSTLVFAVSVEHASVLLEGLREEGARGELITANTPDGVRRDYIGRLERGDLDCLVSVGVLTTGVDIPSLRAILCCRPTESYNLWIQILGRGTRPFLGKSHFAVYDLSGNLRRHGPIEAEPIADLEGLPTIPKIALKTCKECYACFESAPICPSCGADCSQVRERTTGTRIHGLGDEKEMVEVRVEPWEIRMLALVDIAKKKSYRKGWIYNQLKLEFGDDAANKAWPRIRALKKWVTKNHGEGRGWAPIEKVEGWE